MMDIEAPNAGKGNIKIRMIAAVFDNGGNPGISSP
jgi:hypothetical protein